MGNASGQDRLFVTPPTDSSLTLGEIYQWNAKNNASRPMVRWYTQEKGIQERNWDESVDGFRRVARSVVSSVGSQDSGKGHIVGILATTGQIDYWTLLSGIILAGYVPFTISPRNSPQAVEYLLESTKAEFLVVSDDKFAASQDICAKLSVQLFRVEDFLSQKSSPNVELSSLSDITSEDPAVIVHSSGSTAFPKPIVFTHRIASQWANTPRESDCDLNGRVLATHSLPMFHAMGVWMTLLAAFSGAIIALPNPEEPPSQPTPERVLAQALSVECSLLYTVPSFLETWAETADAIDRLRQIEVVAFGGGPLAEHSGNILVKHGVQLVNTYGLSEVGSITKFWSKRKALEDGGWVYWEMLPSLTPELIPVEGMDDHYRLVAKETETYVLAKSNTILDDGSMAYDTNDIIARHPKDPKLWKIVGRFDDQIMHSTGEKTNPGPMEAILRRSAYVQDALMFGRSRFHAGIIISPTEQGRSMTLLELVDAIWPQIELANKFAPTHSRLLAEMIITETPDKPFEYSAKGSLRRGAVTGMYEEEISAVYDKFESVTNGIANGDSAHKESSFEDTLYFVRETVKLNIPIDVGDDSDIFQDGGGDSLSASRIRNALLKTQVHSSVIPPDFVFMFPTISKMAVFIYGINLGTHAASNEDEDEDKNSPDLVDNKTTIVRFHEAPEEQIPLIMLHGGAGNIFDLWIMQGYFTTGFWAIQVTPETPLTSLEAQTDFYFQKIKEQQPHGPYRIGGYSGSTILACRLAVLMEANGDEIVQLVLVDQFPTTFVHAGLMVNDRKSYVERSMLSLADMFRRDTFPRRWKLANEMLNAFYGKPSTELGQMLAGMFPKTFGLILDFVVGLRESEDEELIDALTRWLKTVKSAVTLYIAKEGVILGLPQTDEWKEMGIRRVYPDARVVYVEGNHFNCVENKEMIADMQNYRSQAN